MQAMALALPATCPDARGLHDTVHMRHRLSPVALAMLDHDADALSLVAPFGVPAAQITDAIHAISSAEAAQPAAR